MFRWILISAFFVLTSQNESYTESLDMKYLSSRELLTTFNFTVVKDSDSGQNEFLYYPRLVKELSVKHSIQDLILTVTQGRWDANWGSQPDFGVPTGALLATVINGTRDTIDQKLEALIESLNGILSTSLSLLPKHFSTAPEQIPVLPLKGEPAKGKFMRFGIMSTETSCTDNLNRILKLFPCHSYGLSTLLKSPILFNSLLQSSSIRIKNDKKRRSLSLIVSTVLRTNPNGWTLSKLFERELKTVCPVAESSRASLSINLKNYEVSGNRTRYDLSKNLEEIWVRRRQEGEQKEERESSKNVRIFSTLAGFDQQTGTIHVRMRGAEDPCRVTVSQIIPYYLTPSLQGLRILCEQRDKWVVPRIAKKGYVFGKREDSARLFQVDFTLPDKTDCEWTIPVEKKLLLMSDYPPDANRGLALPAAIAFVRHYDGSVQTLASNTISVGLPVPDFSMPFNVICIVATAVMVAFGAVLSYSTTILAPVRHVGKAVKRLRLVFAGVVLSSACYLQYHEISPNEIRRSIAAYWQNLNDMS